MKKITFLFLLLFATSFYGQLSYYTFTQTTGTYTPVATPTTVLNGSTDSGFSPLTNIGFNFVLDGTTYTQFSATSNGHVRLGSTGNSTNYTPISSSNNGPAIAFFARDGKTNSAVVYEVTGTAPSRVLTIEYPFYFVDWSFTANTLSAQIKLYEGTNKVEIVYGASNRVNTYTGQVGIVSNLNSNYSNRTTTTDWSNSSAGSSNTSTMTWSSTVGPVSGLTYTWTPPTCLPPSSLSTNTITSSGATLNWTASPSDPGFNYDVYWNTTNTAPTGTTTPSDTDITSAYNAVGLSPATTYYWWVRANCGTGDTSVWMSGPSFTTGCVAASAPTPIESFDSFTGAAPSPACWLEATGTLAASSVLTGTISNWLLKSNGFANISSANKGASINLYQTKKEWLISNPIDLGATAGDYQLRYKYAVTSYNGTAVQSTLGTHRVSVVVSTDGGLTWSDANVIKNYTGAGTYSNIGAEEIIPLTAYSGVVKIAFVATTSTTTPDIDFHLDDIIVEAVSLGLSDSNLDANAIVFVKNNQINITAASQTILGVVVYDLQGRKLFTKQSINASELVIEDVLANNQIVLVEIQTENGKITKKVKL